jgi:hypothetical protein
VGSYDSNLKVPLTAAIDFKGVFRGSFEQASFESKGRRFMFRHIKPPLTMAELREAEALMAQGFESGWITREILAQCRKPVRKTQPKFNRGEKVRHLLPGEYD